jgi:hypothetical protein
MTLYRNSRYADTNTRDEILVDVTGNRYRTLYRYPSIDGTLSVSYYVWKASDRIDRLAAEHLGSPDLYYRILDLNPEIIDPHHIEPGTKVRLP